MNTIKFPSPPAGAMQALNEGLKNTKAAANALGATLNGGAPGDTNNYSHPVYTLTLSELKDGKGIDDLTLVGWRYILNDPGGTPYSVEAAYDQNANNYLLSEINHGPFPVATKNFVATADDQPAATDDAPELRVVRIPGIYVFAIWLHGATDRFIVLEPTDAAIRPNTPYNAQEFFALLQSLAAKRLEFDDTPQH